MKIKTLSVAAAAAFCIAQTAAAASVTLPEGTELTMRLEDGLSSKTSNEGDRFTVSLTDDVRLADGTVLRAGYRGVGEIVDARKSGMLGKTGKIAIQLNYLRVGDQRIKLRASKGVQGSHNTGAQVGALLLLWPVAPFIKGKSTQLVKGTTLTAFSDQDTVLETPLPPPPPDA